MASRSSPSPSLSAQFEAWEALVTAYWRLSALLEQAMASSGLPPLAWYDVLSALDRAPQRRLRMSQLAEHVLLSRSGLTRLVDQLEKKGLLRRARCSDDGRGLHAELTPQGRALLPRMSPVYRKTIRQHFASEITSAEAAQLTMWMRRMVASLPAGQSANAPAGATASASASASTTQPARRHTNVPAAPKRKPKPKASSEAVAPANTAAMSASQPESAQPQPQPTRALTFEFDPLLD